MPRPPAKNEPQTKPRAGRSRWRRRLLFTLILAPLVADFVYTRLTVMPPGTSDPMDYSIALNFPPARTDRSEDLRQAVLPFAQLPPFTGPPAAPADFKWFDPKTGSFNYGSGFSFWGFMVNRGGTLDDLGPLNPTAALWGEWSPQTRAHMGAIVKYLESPGVRGSLDAVAAVSCEPTCLWPLGSGEAAGFSNATTLLTARARYRLAAQDDLPAAAEDVLAVLSLARGIADDQTTERFMLADQTADLALREIAHWGHEFALDPAEARRLVARLEELTPDIPQIWGAAIRGDCILAQRVIDRSYTKRASGNGWYVLYQGEGERPGDWLLNGLNLFSPFFEDRKTVQRTWSAYREHAIAAGTLPHEQARDLLQRLIRPVGRAPNPAYPPCLEKMPATYCACLDWLLMHRAAIACVGLSAYRHDHGHYPDTLRTLVPEYLSAVPQDPVTDRPLQYERLSELEFRLVKSPEWDVVYGFQEGSMPLAHVLPTRSLVLPTRRLPLDQGGPYYGRPVTDFLLVPSNTPARTLAPMAGPTRGGPEDW